MGASKLFVAGSYTATLASQSLGAMEAGFQITRQDSRDEIRIDEYGNAIVDILHLGGNILLDFELSEWNIAARDYVTDFWEQQASGGTIGTLSTIGQFANADGAGGTSPNLAAEIILSPRIEGTGQFQYTFPICVPDGDRAWNLNNRKRTVRSRWLVLPDHSDGKLYTRATTP